MTHSALAFLNCHRIHGGLVNHASKDAKFLVNPILFLNMHQLQALKQLI